MSIILEEKDRGNVRFWLNKMSKTDAASIIIIVMRVDYKCQKLMGRVPDSDVDLL